jgi:hypothetical protein
VEKGKTSVSLRVSISVSEKIFQTIWDENAALITNVTTTRSVMKVERFWGVI